jgi:hypothetical protein
LMVSFIFGLSNRYNMAILKFRVYYEEDDSVYRDVLVKHNQHFLELHHVILKAYEFDQKHEATFFRSNDHWQRGREISLEKYDKEYRVGPLLMSETTIGSEIKDPNQKFVYLYDFTKGWNFLIELIHVSREENSKLEYPNIAKSEGIGPSQYGTRGLIGDKLAEVEEKYDLNKSAEGFSEVGEESGDLDMDEEVGPEEDSTLE